MTVVRRISIAALCCAATLGLCAAQAPAGSLTLPEAVKLALDRNPEILIAMAQLDELEGKISEVRAEAWPKVSLEGFGLRLRDPSILNSSSFDKVPQEFRDALIPVANNLFDVAITVKQPLYNAGKVRNAVNLAEESREEKLADLETARRQVTFKVLQAFYDLLLARENLEVVSETRQQREKHLEIALGRFNQGVATEIDVLRSKVHVANTEPDLIRARNRIRLARSTLNNLIVVDLDAPTEAAGGLEYRAWPIPGLAEIQRQAMQDRPELQAARRVVQQSKLLLALANSENKLAIDLDGRWGYSVREPRNFFNSDFSRWTISFNFKLPFYDGGRKAGLVVQARSRLRAAEHNTALMENGVRLQIKAAYDDMQSSAEAIAAAQLNVIQAEKVLAMMQSNYQYGAVTTLDVVDSQTALAVSRNTRINAIYEYEVAKARLRLAAGRPVLEEEGIIP